MKAINTKEILSILESLPNDQKKEVYNFIESLKAGAIKEKKRGFVKKVFGLTRGSKLTSELFSKIKGEEMALESKL